MPDIPFLLVTCSLFQILKLHVMICYVYLSQRKMSTIIYIFPFVKFLVGSTTRQNTSLCRYLGALWQHELDLVGCGLRCCQSAGYLHHWKTVHHWDVRVIRIRTALNPTRTPTYTHTPTYTCTPTYTNIQSQTKHAINDSVKYWWKHYTICPRTDTK